MSERKRRRFRLTVFSALPVLLVVAAIVPVFLLASAPAGAINASDWSKVRTYIDSYISSQFQPEDDGEAGFVLDAAAVHQRIDSNNDIDTLGTAGVLGEGDDAAGVPVLVDVLASTPNVIPGTSARCIWNGTTGLGCLETSQINTIKNRVNAHEAAGFSTDVVAYCATGHTESPTTGGFGYVAQAGGLGAGITPNVYAFKWGRNGWANTSKTYANAFQLIAPGSPSITSYATNPNANCSSSVSDAELVRCTALWMVSPSGGNIGSGVNPPLSNYQVIDIRAGNVSLTVNGGILPSLHVPIQTAFNSGLQLLPPDPGAVGGTEKLLFVNRTQHTAGIVAGGARMLGYPATFLQWGLPNYNNALDEKWVSSGHAYPVQTATANNLTSGVDLTAPTVSGISADLIGFDSASITRATASEPATMKVEYGIAPGVYTQVVNDKVLNQNNKSVNLTGLSAATTYYYRVTSYDGQANGSASSEQYFITGCPTGRPDLRLASPGSFWASYADYTARKLSVTWTVNNTGELPADNVELTGSTSTYAPIITLTAMPAQIGFIGAGGSGSVVVQFLLPTAGGVGFHVANTATAMDLAGNVYVYP